MEKKPVTLATCAQPRHDCGACQYRKTCLRYRAKQLAKATVRG